MPIEEVRKNVDFSKAVALFGDTERIKRTAQALFFEPMVLSAYREARGQAIVQGEDVASRTCEEIVLPSRGARITAVRRALVLHLRAGPTAQPFRRAAAASCSRENTDRGPRAGPPPGRG